MVRLKDLTPAILFLVFFTDICPKVDSSFALVHHDVNVINGQVNTSKQTFTKQSQTMKIISVNHHHHHPWIGSRPRPRPRPGIPTVCPPNLHKIVTSPLDLKKMPQLLTKVTYVPMASPEYYEAVYALVKEEKIEKVNLETICIHRVWNFVRKELRIFSANDHAVLRCRETESKHSLACTSKTDPSYKSEIGVAATDGKTYALMVRCPSKDKTHWYVVSTTPTLAKPTKEEIIKIIKELGLPIDKIAIPGFDKCDHLNKTVRHPCFNDSISASQLGIVKDFIKIEAYIPFASKTFYQHASFLMTQKSLGKNKIEDACMKRSLIHRESEYNMMFTLFGFGHSQAISCNMYEKNKILGFKCRSKRFPNFNWNANPVLTDGKNYILMGVCFPKGPHAWFVLSRHKYIESDAKKQILAKLMELGFTQHLRGVLLNYDKCRYSTDIEVEPPIITTKRPVTLPPKPPKTTTEFIEPTTEPIDVVEVESTTEPTTTTDYMQESTTEPTTEPPSTTEPTTEPPSTTEPPEPTTTTKHPISTDCFVDEPVSFTKEEHKFFEDMMKVHAYIPMASRKYYDRIAAIVGERVEGNIDKVCMRRKWISGTIEIKAFETKVGFKCTNENEGTYTPYYKCVRKDNPRIGINVRPVFTDGKTMMLALACEDKPKPGHDSIEKYWFVVSSRDKLDKKWKDLVDEKVVSVGFPSDDVLEIPYDSCPHETDDPPTDEPCFTDEAVTFSEEENKFFKDMKKVNAYIPVASRNYYAKVAGLVGERVSAGNVDKVCMRKTWPLQTQSTITTFGKPTSFDCIDENEGTLSPYYKCISNANREVGINARPVFTDGKTMILALACENKPKSGHSATEKYWLVISSRDKLDQKWNDQVFEKIESLGFQKEQSLKIPFDSCDDDNVIGDQSTPKPGCFDDLTSLTADELKFQRKMSREPVHINWGSRKFFNEMSDILSDAPLDESKVNEICLKREWNSDMTELTLNGFGNEKMFQCSNVDGPGSYSCKTEGFTGSEVTVEFQSVYTDEINFIVLVGCRNNERFWFVVSRTGELSNVEKLSIRTQLRIMGVLDDTNNKVEIEAKNKNCHATPTEPVDPKMQRCIKILESPTHFSSSDRQFIKELMTKEVYLPDGNRLFMNELSVALTGKQMNKQDNSFACYKARSRAEAGQQVLKGFGQKILLDYEAKTYGKTKNPGFISSSGDQKYYTKMAVLHTDGESYVSAFGCVKNGDLVWAIASLENKLPEGGVADAETRKKLKELGLDPTEESRPMDYGNCNEDTTEGPIEDEPECSKLMRTPTSFTEDDLEFIDHLRTEKVHVPQGSRNYYDAISQAFIGQGFNEQPMDDMCLEKVYSTAIEKHVLSAYGLEKNLIITNKTYGPTNNPGGEFESEDGKYKVKMAILDTDGKHYMFGVGCSKNNEVIWMVAAPQRKLDNEFRNMALEKRKQLNLEDLDGRLLSSSRNCDFSTIEYDERTCAILKTETKFSSKDRKFIRELMAGDIFFTYADRDLLNELSQTLTGTTFDEDDMTKACLKVKFNEATKEQIVTGYGQEKIMDYRSKIYGATKNPGWQALGKREGEFDSKMAVIITDGETYAVLAGCMDDKTVWVIAAREDPKLEVEIRAMLSERITALGIDLHLPEWRRILRDRCQDEPSPPEDTGDLDNPDVCSRKTDISQQGLDYIEKLKGKVLLDYQGNTDYFDAIKDMLLGGKSPDDETENACISKFYSKDNNQLIITGYKNKELKFNCEYIPHDETHNPGAKCKSEDGNHEFGFNVLHTDGKSYALTAFCRKDNDKIGFVVNLLPHTTLTPDVENYIKELVEKHTGETIYELDTPDTDGCEGGEPSQN